MQKNALATVATHATWRLERYKTHFSEPHTRACFMWKSFRFVFARIAYQITN